MKISVHSFISLVCLLDQKLLTYALYDYMYVRTKKYLPNPDFSVLERELNFFDGQRLLILAKEISIQSNNPIWNWKFDKNDRRWVLTWSHLQNVFLVIWLPTYFHKTFNFSYSYSRYLDEFHTITTTECVLGHLIFIDTWCHMRPKILVAAIVRYYRPLLVH